MREKEIRAWIHELITKVGPPREPIDERPLRALYADSNFAGMLDHIRKSMRLDVGLRIGYVNSGGPAHAAAWVSLPAPMPQYGTREFKQSKFDVYIRKSVILQSPFEIVVALMAHELSHILLDAIHHPLRRQEAAVDLTAMILGYDRFFSVVYTIAEEVPRADILARVYKWFVGRELTDIEVSYQMHTSGYMSAEEIGFAQSLIRS